MKFIVDASVLLAVGDGDWLKIQALGATRKCHVAAPEPVIAHTRLAVRAIPKPGAVDRFTWLMAEMPRVPWTTAVTEKMLALDAEPDDLAALTVAHALVYDAKVLTLEPERYARFSHVGVGVEELLV